MKYSGTIYRPPIEAGTLLLQVTVGCAHNNCTYCTMYKDIPFTTENITQIENDLKEAKQSYGSVKRIFLVNGDAFVLSARRLKEIANKVIEYFPEMETITMYASIRNIMDKSDDELKELRSLRINDLWVGLETGNEETLRSFNKGYTLKDTYEQLERLNINNINHNAIFIIGAAGKSKGIINATDSAHLINITKPQLVGITTLGVFPGSELEKSVNKNLFTPATELEILEEEKKLLELINLENLPFYGSHPINTSSLNGILPRDKEKMIKVINESIRSSSHEFLENVAFRNSL